MSARMSAAALPAARSASISTSQAIVDRLLLCVDSPAVQGAGYAIGSERVRRVGSRLLSPGISGYAEGTGRRYRGRQERAG